MVPSILGHETRWHPKYMVKRAGAAHRFKTSLSSMMPIFPLLLGDIIVKEINRYAAQKVQA